MITIRLVYDVDPKTFAPLAATFSSRFGGRRIGTTRMRVDVYRRTALDATTAKLLEIRRTPRTTVTYDTAQRARGWRERCRRLKSGDLACPAPKPPG